ncbi:type IV pilus biogenesis protein PilM [Geobacter argillaceus]|uniref:Type IV pilus assembly protein PilM n=1 Tax=Geobacter argillaceus TaxID=345631 RepID=A0A562VML7_9BACT|nr:pilus assembly protein PilM [Geobacter argillaceus]TWJ19149.1 type IV pilus assembly protein PilM [Geobacter argillaceus]
MFLKTKAIGLEIAHEGATIALAGKRRGLPVLERCESVSFPAGTLRLSLKEPNIIDRPFMVGQLRELHARLLTNQKQVSLSLPDAAGRVMLLDLETRLKSKEEGADLIRWKLKKNLPIDISEIHLDYQILRERESGELSALVALVSRSVITQYEEIVSEVGLEPIRIDFTTFNLVRLFLRMVGQENTAVILWYKGVISILIFHDGVLEFFRAKEIFEGSFETNRVFRELNSSFLVYRDKVSGQKLQRVLFYSPPWDREALQTLLTDVTGVTPYQIDLGRCVGQSESPASESMLYSSLAAVGAAARIF